MSPRNDKSTLFDEILHISHEYLAVKCLSKVKVYNSKNNTPNLFKQNIKLYIVVLLTLGLRAFRIYLSLRGHAMEHGNDCSEIEAHRVLKKDWTITVAELRSFLGILYIRCAYEARSLKASKRLQTDKFALISEIWNRFISNSQACYKLYENTSIDEQLLPTKVRCRFTQYILNKPHKFGIKFWLAVDVQTKYILNGFPYMGKDETRCSREKRTR